MLSKLFLKGFSIEGVFEEAYLNGIPALRYLKDFSFKAPVTFFVGENGTGKSTLLEALAVQCGFNPEGGSKNFSFATMESHSALYENIRVARSHLRPKTGYFMRAESYYNVASEIERLDAEPSFGPKIIDAYGGVSLHKQSHGESFFSLFVHRFRPGGLYILDEPEAALSPARQMALLVRLHELVQGGAQFIIATHSPILMAYPGAVIVGLSPEGAGVIPYTETDHYTVMKHFLNNPEAALHHLFEA